MSMVKLSRVPTMASTHVHRANHKRGDQNVGIVEASRLLRGRLAEAVRTRPGGSIQEAAPADLVRRLIDLREMCRDRRVMV